MSQLRYKSWNGFAVWDVLGTSCPAIKLTIKSRKTKSFFKVIWQFSTLYLRLILRWFDSQLSACKSSFSYIYFITRIWRKWNCSLGIWTFYYGFLKLVPRKYSRAMNFDFIKSGKFEIWKTIEWPNIEIHVYKICKDANGDMVL